MGDNKKNYDKVEYAKAPYNFIPFPEKYAVKYKSVDDLPTHDYLDPNLNTGYISYTITAETPIYVGGENGEFYSIGDNYAIPGSTIKGKLRGNSEVLSNSYPEFIKDTKYSFRDMAGKSSSIKNEYSEYFKTSRTRKINKVVNAGLIENSNGKYTIHQLEEFKDIDGMTQNFMFITDELIRASIKEEIFSKSLSFENYEPYFLLCESNDYNNKLPNSKLLDNCRILIKNESEFKKSSYIGNKSGNFILMNSGNFNNKKNHYLLNGKVIKTINVSDKVIYDAQIRLNRAKGKNEDGSNHSTDYHKLPKSGYMKPCFYLMDRKGNKDVISVGFTPYLRLPYKYSTTDGINGEKPFGISYSDGLFGFTTSDEGNGAKSYKSRVTCGHAVSELPINKSDELPLKYILQKPKPTSFQMYLKQESSVKGKSYNSPIDLLHYNSNIDKKPIFELRGRKFYWMKKYKDDSLNNKPDLLYKNERIIKTLNTLAKGTAFKGKIYFKNVDNAELGLLLFSLKFDETNISSNNTAFYESFGQGKPFGLGRTTIDINEVHLENIESRYSRTQEFYGSSINLVETINLYKSEYIKEYNTNVSELEFNWNSNKVISSYKLSKMIGEPLDEDDNFCCMDMENGDYDNKPVLRSIDEYIDKFNEKNKCLGDSEFNTLTKRLAAKYNSKR